MEEYLVGESCPRCNVPSHAKDVMTNRQLSTAVSLVKQLDTLLAGKLITVMNLIKLLETLSTEVSLVREVITGVHSSVSSPIHNPVVASGSVVFCVVHVFSVHLVCR